MLPFRIGTTSYIIEADLVANARFLAGKVDDMQLVLFDLPDGRSNIPSPQVVAELAQIGAASGLTYAIHLIDDLQAGGNSAAPSLRSARRLIDLFAPLSPSAWVLHLEGRAVRSPHVPAAALQQWQNWMSDSLGILAGWVTNGVSLAVENLEGYPPEFVTPVVERTSAGRCVDVGHLWLDGFDPLPHLRAALPRTRMVHLHGLKDGRDHQSLAHMSPRQIDPIVSLLVKSGYAGIVTLEIFGEDDFATSLATLKQSILSLSTQVDN